MDVARAQLEHVRRRYRPVKLRELTSAIERRRPGEQFPVAISFDDDSREHVERAAPLLRGLGLHATFFLSGPEPGGAPWWESVNLALEAGRSSSRSPR